MDEQSLGKQLQAARQSAGLTQQQLATQANLSFSTLTKIERGAIKSPSIFTIQSIAGALGTGLDELVGQKPSVNTGRNLQKTKSGVSFVYFDVNGCLVHFYQRAFAKVAEASGQPADMVERFYWQHNDDVCRGTMSLSDFNTELARCLGMESIAWQKYYQEAVEPITQMQELLQWASERYRIGLLTNIMPGFLSAMRREGIVPDLNYDAIVDSSVVGAIKPDIKIYNIALENAGVPQSEIMLVDDTPSNLMAAEKLGWHILSFDDARPEESAESIRQALEPAT